MSVGVNVVLAIAVVAVWRRPVSSGVEAQPLARVVTNVTPKIVVAASTNEAVPGLAERIQWREVASEDLTNYVANLRRVGCPAATVRDIIAGELQDIFLRRRKALIAPLQNEFWNLAMRGMNRSDGPFEKVKEQIDQLEKETIDRLDELAGADSEKKADEQRRRSKAFSYLPEEKQAALVALNEKFANLRRAARGSEANSNPAARERLAELQKQREAEVKQLLTPEEFTEYRLRTSPATRFVARLVGFETTEEELRAIARVRLDFESAEARLDAKAPDYQAKLAEQQESKKKRDEAVKALLGEPRFADFTQAQDGAYQQIYKVAERYGLPRETAMAADGIRQIAVDQVKAVQGNKELPPEQRQAALRAIREETERTLGETFGADPLKTYLKNGGDWLKALGGR